MRIATISSKRQITLAKSLLEKYHLFPSDKIIIEEKKVGLILKPLKESIVSGTFGALSEHIPQSKKNLSYDYIIKETKRIIGQRLKK